MGTKGGQASRRSWVFWIFFDVVDVADVLPNHRAFREGFELIRRFVNKYIGDVGQNQDIVFSTSLLYIIMASKVKGSEGTSSTHTF